MTDRPGFVRRLLPTIVVVVALGGVPPSLIAQTAAAAELKAAFLLNFARFTTWPDLPASAPLTLCVFGDDRVVGALAEAVRGRTAEGRSLSAVRAPGGAEVHACQLLFLSAAAFPAAQSTLDSARGLPILTVSDAERFAQSTGMIELSVRGDRMQFAINVAAVERAKLRISSRLLALATIVRQPDAS